MLQNYKIKKEHNNMEMSEYKRKRGYTSVLRGKILQIGEITCGTYLWKTNEIS